MSAENQRPLKLMLVCGEPSGDQLGAELMARLRSLHPHIDIVGVGGSAMTAEGLHSLFPLDATAVMGVRAVLPKIPEILRRVRIASDFALRARPDALVCIDSPDFTHRIAQQVRKRDAAIPTVNYVAPQVWASRQYRARRMARYFDLVLALLPFEAPFFETHGLHARFVGHPVVERAARMEGGKELRARLGLADHTPLLAVLPGSRSSEVRPLLPIFRDAIDRARKVIPDMVCVLPAVPHLRNLIQEMTTDWPTALRVVGNEADKFAAFGAADAALAASGTVTTELALAGVPMVVAYRVGPLTAAVARRLIRVPFATLINLLLKREAVPEFIQERCRADLLAPALTQLFTDDGARARQRQDLREAIHLLGVDDEPPSLRAARVLLDFVQQRCAASPQRSVTGA